MSEPVRFTRAYLEQRAQELEAQCAEYKRLGQQLERDSRSFFEQSCKNLKRAEKAETESAGWKAAMNVHAERAEKAERELDLAENALDVCQNQALEEAAKVAEAEAERCNRLDPQNNRLVVTAIAVAMEKLAAAIRALKTGGGT